MFPLRAMAADDVVRYRVEIETAEQSIGTGRFGDLSLKSHANLLLPSIDALTRLPSILDPVSSILGDDLLVWGCTLFIKEPRSKNFVSWHQDLNYWGLENDDQVTAWVALSPATVESGCMRFVAGSHRRIVDHKDTFAADNMLSRGQEVAVTVDEDMAHNVILEPGEFSLHHGRTFHASHPNLSDERRIGVAVRYIPTSSRQNAGARTTAMLVRGQDAFGNFELFDPPEAPLSLQAIGNQKRALQVEYSIMYDGAEHAIKPPDQQN